MNPTPAHRKTWQTHLRCWGGGLLLGALAPLAVAASTAPSPTATAAPHAPLNAQDETPPDPTVHPDATWKAPRYLLQGPNGRAVTANDFQGRFQLVAFGFVSCPDVCPTTLMEMQQILQTLGESRARQLQPIFISVDPERDTLQVLGAYTQAIDRRILGLTGRPDLVKWAAQEFGVVYTKVQEPGAPANVYTMDHTAGMFLLGPEGQLLARFGYSTPVPRMVDRIQQWMDRSAEATAR